MNLRQELIVKAKIWFKINNMKSICPKCGKRTLISYMDIDYCEDESCGYSFRYP